MLEVKQAAKIMAGVKKALSDLGKKGDTKFPNTNSKQEEIARAMFITNMVLSQAQSDKAKLEEMAVAESMICDKRKDPRPPGTNEICWSGECAAIMLSVDNPRVMVDSTELVKQLRKRGVSDKIIDDCVEKATKKAAPAHKFKVVLLTEKQKEEEPVPEQEADVPLVD